MQAVQSIHAQAPLFDSRRMFAVEPHWEDGFIVCELVGADYLDVRGAVILARGRCFAFAYSGARRFLGNYGSRRDAKAAVMSAIREAKCS
ncbi:MAG TPA: hypothetical protein VHZ25_17850 [Acidobacteriaceae bacterium]|jgi:hypothetical protein|nr:hypothetical protein [Acidobacteriaceae bacterium]